MGPILRASALLAFVFAFSSCGGGKSLTKIESKGLKTKYSNLKQAATGKANHAAKERPLARPSAARQIVKSSTVHKATNSKETKKTVMPQPPPAADKKATERPVSNTRPEAEPDIRQNTATNAPPDIPPDTPDERYSLRTAVMSGIRTGVYLFSWVNTRPAGLN